MRLSVLLTASLAFLAPFSASAQKKGEDKKPADSALSIEGTELKPGKKIVFSLELNEGNRKNFAKVKGGGSYTKLKVGVALPADFKPSNTYPFLVVCSTDSGSATPVSSLDPMVAEGTKAGFIVLAAEPDGQRPSDADATAIYFQAFAIARDTLVAKFPSLGSSTYVAAGHSGGGKRAGFFASLMEANNLKVSGIYMSGVNVDTLAMTKNYAKLRKVPIFVSNGSKDSYVPADRNAAVLDSLKKAGFRNVKSPGHDGGHVIVPAHLKEALEWFKLEAL